MKKNYFMLAAATMMFAACAETDLVNEVNMEEAPKAIGFETFANKTTRTGNDSRTALNSYHTTFGVWTYKSTSTTEDPVMDNYKVSYKVTQTTDASGNTVSTPSWEYAGEQGTETQTLKYWDKNAEYSFYAYAPYSTTVTIDANKNIIIIPWGEYAANENLQESLSATPNTNDFTGVGSSNNAKSTDWLIATPITGYKDYTQEVNETFAHTMSRLIVKVSSTVANTMINSISVNGVYGMGMYDGSEWKTSYTENEQVTTAPSESIEGKTGSLATANTEYYTMEYLLIPSAEAPTFSISYTINGDTYGVTDKTITNIGSFAANTSYTLSVSIDLSAIEFTATAADFATTVENGSVDIE